jgi:DNA adenine methylase
VATASKRDLAWSKPLFRWAGSKRSLLPELHRCVPQTYRRYIEPFAGSACLFFALKPDRAVLSDFNADLMHAYRMFAQHPRRVVRLCEGLPNTSDAYYTIRAMDPSSLTQLEQAARFFYLNRRCFNGVYRTDKLNRFNVPLGTRTGPPVLEADAVRCSVALRKAELVTGDFACTLDRAARGDFVYLDPPYTTSTRATYGEYGYGAFGHDDIQRLLSALERLTARGVKVLLSYAVDAKVLDALEGWNVETLWVRRQVAGGAQNRHATEILASNFNRLKSC